MEKTNNFHEYVYPVIILTVIAFVATLLLALTNMVSAPVIAKNSAARADATRKEVLADGDSFAPVQGLTDSDLARSSDGKASIESTDDVQAAANGAGYVMTVHTTSFGGDLTMMVGIDKKGAVTGVKVTDHSDTPGVGTKDQADDYLAQYVGKTELTSPLNVKKEKDFQYISGASVSGTAIHRGVGVALDEYKAVAGK